MDILGISAYYHDSAACLIRKGEIIAAAQEERFSRKKHDSSFPVGAIRYCLKEAGTELKALNYVVFYENPYLKFNRLIGTYLAYAPKGFPSFNEAMSSWFKGKLFLRRQIKEELIKSFSVTKKCIPPILFTSHHLSHAASAFFPSPFTESAVLCLDGVGEWATTSIWQGEKNMLHPIFEIKFPHSIGLVYSAFTYFTGFKVNSGEYKLMGLAPYGEPRFVSTILNNLLDIKDDGTFRINMEYFDYAAGLTMVNGNFYSLFGGGPRKPESPITQREMDIACSIQIVTEEIVLRLANTAYRETGMDNLCLAGGVALNCVANGRVLREGPFKHIWIQPAAGDAGGAIGSALTVWFQYLKKEREASEMDTMKGSFLGPSFTSNEIKSFLDSVNAKYRYIDDEILIPQLATLLDEGKVIGLLQGRMEFGPRSLGNRSIVGDARNSKMQSIMNLKIKYRESFRPFAPSVLAEEVSNYFELSQSSPYMLLVCPVNENIRIKMTPVQEALFGIDKLKVPRSKIPAVTHVDYSARVQTVQKDSNPRFYNIIKSFFEKTGCAVLVNTSFNVRGEPIVCTPEDAYRCFMRTEMDYLILENYLLYKNEQPKWKEDGNWKNDFTLD